MNRYFRKFPKTTYNGYVARDLTVAAKVVDKYVNLPYQYTQFTLDSEQRADVVANDYYKDPYMSWVVYYANKVIDPYTDWMLADEDFNNFIVSKYGSLEVAQTTVVEFRSNWYADSRELSPSHFDSLFGEYGEPHSKYWTPVYSEESDKILSYVRRRSENVVNTNKIVRVGISNNASNKFTAGDLVDVKSAYNASTALTGEVLLANSSSMTLKNLIGTTMANGYVVALDSNSSVYCSVSNYTTSSNTASTTWTITNISDEEYVYWTPYTAYDMEREKNESKKNIKLIDGLTAKRISDKLEEELS